VGAVRKFFSGLGSAGMLIGMLAIGGLVWWNMMGAGRYGDTCEYSLGCRSFACMHHGLRGSAQVTAPGVCSKPCDADADCGAGATCVKLDEFSRDDLPPFGKPEKACLRAVSFTGDTSRH
jgi:hypothetical protein